jgi:hypothetical protein
MDSEYNTYYIIARFTSRLPIRKYDVENYLVQSLKQLGESVRISFIDLKNGEESSFGPFESR